MVTLVYADVVVSLFSISSKMAFSSEAFVAAL